LIPAVRHALIKGKQVFISTNTKTLQDQIEKKDILQVQEYFQSSLGRTFSFQKLKGRQNYVSILKYFEFFDQQTFSYESAIFAIKIGFWLTTTQSGELDDLSLYGVEFSLLDEIHAGDLRVLSPENPYRDFEFVFRARNRAKLAHIVILNHALLLSEYLEDAETGLLPKIETLVLDEVHNLESVATETLKKTSEFSLFEKAISDIEKTIKKFNKTKPLEAFVTPELTRLSESILLSSAMIFEGLEKYFQALQGQQG
jgi:Rad3-related DNA helicase